MQITRRNMLVKTAGIAAILGSGLDFGHFSTPSVANAAEVQFSKYTKKFLVDIDECTKELYEYVTVAHGMPAWVMKECKTSIVIRNPHRDAPKNSPLLFEFFNYLPTAHFGRFYTKDFDNATFFFGNPCFDGDSMYKPLSMTYFYCSDVGDVLEDTDMTRFLDKPYGGSLVEADKRNLAFLNELSKIRDKYGMLQTPYICRDNEKKFYCA